MAKFIYKGSDIRRFTINEEDFCLLPGRECELPETDYVLNLEAKKVLTRCVKQTRAKAIVAEEKKDEPKISE